MFNKIRFLWYDNIGNTLFQLRLIMETQNFSTYSRNKSAVFLRTAELFGGLSNMAGGYPLSINNIRILTTEALYQACRFPHLPEVQKLIIGQNSPMTAKMKSKPFRKESRPDWDDIRIPVMRWCLHVKLAQNWEKFSTLLLSTENCPIVEESYRDQFWGAKPIDTDSLSGINVLGQLLTELREQLQNHEYHILQTVAPLEIPQFLLVNRPIGMITNSQLRQKTASIAQQSLFERDIVEPDSQIEGRRQTEPLDSGRVTSALYSSQPMTQHVLWSKLPSPQN
jgi:type I restriction enzyme S subunit